MVTRGVSQLGSAALTSIFDKLRTFTDFDTDNDPYGEHDMGGFEVFGQSVLWKIDYYDACIEYGSSDPADPDVTTRVLTIMLADEY